MSKLDEKIDELLELIQVIGLRKLPEGAKQELQGYLEQRLLTRVEVNLANQIYLAYSALDMLKLVGREGLSEKGKADLNSGLRIGLYTKNDIRKAQRKYESDKK